MNKRKGEANTQLKNVTLLRRECRGNCNAVLGMQADRESYFMRHEGIKLFVCRKLSIWLSVNRTSGKSRDEAPDSSHYRIIQNVGTVVRQLSTKLGCPSDKVPSFEEPHVQNPRRALNTQRVQNPWKILIRGSWFWNHRVMTCFSKLCQASLLPIAAYVLQPSFSPIAGKTKTPQYPLWII